VYEVAELEATRSCSRDLEHQDSEMSVEVLAQSTTAFLNQPLKVGRSTFSKMGCKGLGNEGTPLGMIVSAS